MKEEDFKLGGERIYGLTPSPPLDRGVPVVEGPVSKACARNLGPWPQSAVSPAA